MKEKHIRSEMKREPLDFPQDKKAQRILKKIPKGKRVILEEPVTKTAYSNDMMRNHKPMTKPKVTKRDKKVGKCTYD